MVVYSYKQGFRGKVDPQIAGEICAKLEAENRLTAQDLVEVSRPETAPLHCEFEWDDSKAAEKYRESQARNIIRHITVELKDGQSSSQEPVRAFYNVVEASPEYESIRVIISDESKYSALLRTALKELRAFSKKYSQLKELGAILEAINQLSIDLDIA